MQQLFEHHPVFSQTVGDLAHLLCLFFATITVMATFSPEFQLLTSGVLMGITSLFGVIYRAFPHSD